MYSSHELGEAKESAGFWPRLAARAHGIEWLYAIRRPDNRARSRAVKDFPGVDSVHELAEGLAPRVAAHQFAGGP